GGPALAEKEGKKIALSGYDVVSYFTKNRAEKGDPKYTHDHKGATYQFSSDEQKKLFINDPGKYLPQYDGYCAYGVTFGKKLEADPEAWKIVNGKLYFNLDKDLLKKWETNTADFIKEGDSQWTVIQDIPASEL
ncbi:MAG: hypothetical protein OEY67_10045, partial [Gammaproteobacteria bacterium]|nr:hypothetical protein [Gammaproteobacteria bacterium]